MGLVNETVRARTNDMVSTQFIWVEVFHEIFPKELE